MFVHVIYAPGTTVLKARENNDVVTLILAQENSRIQIAGTKEDMDRFFNVVARVIRNPEKVEKMEVTIP